MAKIPNMVCETQTKEEDNLQSLLYYSGSLHLQAYQCKKAVIHYFKANSLKVILVLMHNAEKI